MSLVSGFTTAYSTPDTFCGSNFYGHPAGTAAAASTAAVVVNNNDYSGPNGQHFFSSSWTWPSGTQGTGGGISEFNSPPLSCYSGNSPYSSPCHYGSDYASPAVHQVGFNAQDPQQSHPHMQHQSSYVMMEGEYNGPPRVRVVKRRNTANKKERRRTQSINNAFTELRDCIPNVPADTKLSKIKTLRLATSYISYLMTVLDAGDAADVPFRAELGRTSKSDKLQQQQQLQQQLQQQQQLHQQPEHHSKNSSLRPEQVIFLEKANQDQKYQKRCHCKLQSCWYSPPRGATQGGGPHKEKTRALRL